MRFFTIAATLVAAVAAQYSAEDTCSAPTTVTVTETLQHTPSAPGAYAPTAPAPYPTMVYSTVVAPVPSGTGYPTVPEASVAPSGTAPASGAASPSGTGASTAPYPEFTGAASGLKVGGFMGAAAIAALFL